MVLTTCLPSRCDATASRPSRSSSCLSAERGARVRERSGRSGAGGKKGRYDMRPAFGRTLMGFGRRGAHEAKRVERGERHDARSPRREGRGRKTDEQNATITLRHHNAARPDMHFSY